MGKHSLIENNECPSLTPILGVVNLEDKFEMNTEMSMTREEAASGVQSMQRGLRKRKSTVEDVEKHIQAFADCCWVGSFNYTHLFNNRCPVLRRMAATTPIPTTCVVAERL
jgi:hypothetical protein